MAAAAALSRVDKLKVDWKLEVAFDQMFAELKAGSCKVPFGILWSTEQIRHIARSVDVDPDCDNIAENLQRYFEKENAHCCCLYEKGSNGHLMDQVTSSALINDVHGL